MLSGGLPMKAIHLPSGENAGALPLARRLTARWLTPTTVTHPRRASARREPSGAQDGLSPGPASAGDRAVRPARGCERTTATLALSRPDGIGHVAGGRTVCFRRPSLPNSTSCLAETVLSSAGVEVNAGIEPVDEWGAEGLAVQARSVGVDDRRRRGRGPAPGRRRRSPGRRATSARSGHRAGDAAGADRCRPAPSELIIITPEPCSGATASRPLRPGKAAIAGDAASAATTSAVHIAAVVRPHMTIERDHSRLKVTVPGHQVGSQAGTR